MEHKNLTYKHISKFTDKSWLKSIWNLSTTLILLYFCFSTTNIFLIPLFSLTLIRIFIIFHDMAHDSFFPNSKVNYFVGLLLGTLVVTPHSTWTFGHNHHHKHSNKLDKKQYSQTSPWDVDRFHNEQEWKKKIYKFVYGGYTLFTIVPTLYFIIVQHLTAYWYENILHLSYLVFLGMNFGYQQLLYILASYLLGGTLGFLLFHSQHTFDNVYKKKEDEWDYFKNGIYGSSFIQVPWFLKYFTCGIEYHHIHHLNTFVPSYNLHNCHKQGEELFRNVNRIYLNDVIKSLNYSLYNTNTQQFENVYNH